MKRENISLRLLLVGAGPRLAVACLVVTALWLGFLWATTKFGAV
mgnify:FL=1